MFTMLGVLARDAISASLVTAGRLAQQAGLGLFPAPRPPFFLGGFVDEPGAGVGSYDPSIEDDQAPDDYYVPAELTTFHVPLNPVSEDELRHCIDDGGPLTAPSMPKGTTVHHDDFVTCDGIVREINRRQQYQTARYTRAGLSELGTPLAEDPETRLEGSLSRLIWICKAEDLELSDYLKTCVAAWRRAHGEEVPS